MDALLIPGIVGGIVGGIVAARHVARLNAKLRTIPCPKCDQSLGEKKAGARSLSQIVWGGWTCPQCGCDVNRHGKTRAA